MQGHRRLIGFFVAMRKGEKQSINKSEAETVEDGNAADRFVLGRRRERRRVDQ